MKNVNELVSVIVPVYNVENYLPRCIESIINQTYSNLEIILVNDGSTDHSGTICEEYKKKDSRIKVIMQRNQGLSAARNAGLDAVHGAYLTFIDSDDYVSEKYVESLFNIMGTADVAICLGEKFYDNAVTVDSPDYDTTEVYTSEVALKNMLYRRGVNSYAWGKLFKAKLFDGVRFPVGVLFEDVMTIYKIYDIADKIAFNKVRLYYYFQRPGSIVNSSFSRKKLDQVKASKVLLEFVSEKYPALKKAAISRYFIAAVDIYRRIPNSKEYESERKELKEIIKTYRAIVLFDRENKMLTRMLSFISLLSVESLSYAGRLYQILTEKNILKFKNPI